MTCLIHISSVMVLNCSPNIQRWSYSCIDSVMAHIVLVVRDDLSDSCIVSVMVTVVLIDCNPFECYELYINHIILEIIKHII